jgi:Pin2-interacting protein X1
MSGDAKRFRALSGSAGRHGDSFWVEEQNNVGMRLLKGMGWEQGQGLGKTGQGRTVVVKQRLKKDNAGIGASANTRDEAFVASQDLFSDVLARLNSGTGGGGGSSAGQASGSLGTAAVTVKGAMARRQMVKRFCRADPIADRDTAMNQIFGRKSGDASANSESGGGEREASSSDSTQLTSSVSVSDYFAQRRKALGFAPSNGSAPSGDTSSKGFTLDDQATFAESQREAAYSGKIGLGARSSARDSDDEAESRAKRLANYAAPKFVAVAPPSAPAPADSKAERKAAKAQAKAEKKEAKRAAKKEAKRAAKAAAAAEPAPSLDKADAKAEKRAAKAAAKAEAKAAAKAEKKKRKRDEA